MIDEDPGSEDIDRFSSETACCPDCGAEIWDQAEVCPSCYAYLGGNVISRTPAQARFRRKWIVLVAILLLLAFVLWML
jgi:hypothetical protein